MKFSVLRFPADVEDFQSPPVCFFLSSSSEKDQRAVEEEEPSPYASSLDGLNAKKKASVFVWPCARCPPDVGFFCFLFFIFII